MVCPRWGAGCDSCELMGFGLMGYGGEIREWREWARK